MKIVLLRHGCPEFNLETLKTRKYRPIELHEVVRRYRDSPLDTSHLPPAECREIVQQCNAVVCSNLPRSLESARLLGFDEIHLSDGLFRESDLPYANWRRPRLSLYRWFILFRLLWLAGYANNGESIRLAKQRARLASQRLTDLAGEHGSVLLVGHGFINYFIARELRAGGWQGPKRPGHDYWGFAVYERPT